ncbi:MAG: heparinase II/III family protein [Verrucomicrobiae bacterium]|nr:heparinase II/III family protein [Verrucomicrobiae bacterium]
MKSQVYLRLGLVLAGVAMAMLPFTRAMATTTNLATLRSGHPRLIVLADDLARIRQFIESDATARQYHQRVIAHGEAILRQPPVERILIGPRLLDKSRTVVDRLYTLGLLHRLDGQAKWRDRAVSEMLAVAGFKDWNPSHFLDVAEMTHGMAIGYDWFYDALTPEQRGTIETAMVEKGLLEAKQAHERNVGWARSPDNWNNVCNGGITVGALAVADREPELANWLVSRMRDSVPKALASYAPDGAWREGPGYWGYATRYTVYLLAALESALGTDFSLGASPGLSDAGTHRLHITGPTGLFFNFADCGESANDDPVLFWLARRYNQPVLAAAQRQFVGERGATRDLMWFDPRGSLNDIRRLPLDAHFKNIHVAVMRSAWQDSEAIYVGFKGGDNQAGHAHLDLGTFVLDALGERWAAELGADDYNMPGYFGSQRWTYYRLKTEGQNTLTLNGANQNTRATAPIINFASSPANALAVADLTKAYESAGATRVWRGVALCDGRSRVLVQDELELAKPADVVWTMHTQAEVTTEGARATLRKGGKILEVRILSPVDAQFSFEEVELARPQRPARGMGKLLVRLSEQQGAVRIAVVLQPGSTPGAVTLSPLAEWKGSTP